MTKKNKYNKTVRSWVHPKIKVKMKGKCFRMSVKVRWMNNNFVSWKKGSVFTFFGKSAKDTFKKMITDGFRWRAMPQVVKVKINSYLASTWELTIKPVAHHLTDKALVLHFVVFMHGFAVLVNLSWNKVCYTQQPREKRGVCSCFSFAVDGPRNTIYVL